MKSYYVYIMASKVNGTLYVGVTNNLQRRYSEHLKGSEGSFTTRKNAKRLVYLEVTDSIESAIAREKQLKNWHRQWKINLIESMNPLWWDLGKRYRLDAETSSA